MTKPKTRLGESLRQRLRNRMRERGEDVQLGLLRYALERFLYRLGESAHRERFVLKGAALFALWGGSVYRATRDLDFCCYGNNAEADVLSAIREICEHEVEDELEFEIATLRAEPIRDDSDYHGFRVRFVAHLGTSRIPVQIDVGFGNAIEPPPQTVNYPTLLGDAAPRIKAYPIEAVVAEKLHAMVLLGERNTRLKDFYDLHVLSSQFAFDGAQLARAIRATFERRRTEVVAALPVALTPRFFADAARSEQWRAYLSRNKLPGAPADFTLVGESLARFVSQLWTRIAANEAVASYWHANGPWRAYP